MLKNGARESDDRRNRRAAGTRDLRGAVCLWALQPAHPPLGPPEDVAVSEERSALALCRCLVRRLHACRPEGIAQTPVIAPGLLPRSRRIPSWPSIGSRWRRSGRIRVLPPFPHGPGGDVFYDDNAWLGLALCRHHELNGSREAADLSHRVLDFVLTGWSTETTWRHPGGIRWKVPASNRSRNTCSNAPVAELAALIGVRDADETKLDWAKRIYAWVHTWLEGADRLYLDQIAPDGTVLPDIWSYNQGTMIGAGVLLHRATEDAGYLAQAESTAQAAVRHFSLDRLVAQGAAFNAVFFRNLLLLDAVQPRPGLQEPGRGVRGTDVDRTA